MFSIYELHLEVSLRHKVIDTVNIKDAIEWLKSNGDTSFIYEFYKNNNLKSRWIWKSKTNKWSRMATPKKK